MSQDNQSSGLQEKRFVVTVSAEVDSQLSAPYAKDATSDNKLKVGQEAFTLVLPGLESDRYGHVLMHMQTENSSSQTKAKIKKFISGKDTGASFEVNPDKPFKEGDVATITAAVYAPSLDRWFFAPESLKYTFEAP